MPRMCLAVVVVAAMSVVGGGARWQQEVAASATLRQEVAVMVAFLQWAVRHRQDIICCRVNRNGQAYRRLRGQRGGGGVTWWSRCGCGGRKCIGAKSEEDKDSQHSRKRMETKTNKQKGKAVSVRPRIRKSPFLELVLPVLVRVPVLEWADFLIPVLELAPFLESPYTQAAISRTSTTHFVPILVLAS
jgi:hypothetical protein